MSDRNDSLVQVFNNSLYSVRVVMRDDNPWFVAKDVAACIEHSNVSKMCDLCRDKDKVVVRPSDLTSNDLLDVKNREYTLISESGLYRILAKCSLPKCEPFENWVFDEVLPSIRKTGSYSALPKTYLESLKALVAAVEAKEKALLEIEEKNVEIKSLKAQNEVLKQEYVSTKDFCKEIIAKGYGVQINGITYALSTLKKKLSPILQELSHKYGYSIEEETVIVDNIERKTPFFHREVCNMVEAVVSPEWLRKPDLEKVYNLFPSGLVQD